MVNNVLTPVPLGTFFGLLLLAYLVNQFAPLVQLVPSPYNVSGWVVIGLGFLLAAWAFATLRSHETTIAPGQVPSALVTGGPFAVSRNPIYLGDLLIVTGTAIAFSSLSTFIAPVLFFVVVNTIVIPFEEQNLQRAFGDTYDRYRRAVRRWI